MQCQTDVWFPLKHIFGTCTSVPRLGVKRTRAQPGVGPSPSKSLGAFSLHRGFRFSQARHFFHAKIPSLKSFSRAREGKTLEQMHTLTLGHAPHCREKGKCPS